MSDWPDCMILSHAQTGVGLSCRGYGLLLKRLAEAEAEIARADYATRRAVERLAEAENDAEAAHAMLAEVSRLTGKRIGESVPESVERIAARLAEAEDTIKTAAKHLTRRDYTEAHWTLDAFLNREKP